ncbi:MAG TPA: cytochrome P450 [Acidimicrobiales bacterium]
MGDQRTVKASEVDLTDRSLYQSGVPHDLFTELRSIGGVIRHPAVSLPGAENFEFWSVVRHHEAQAANRDWETFTAVDGPGITPQALYRDAEMIVSFDPPDHTRVRRLLSSGFTPRMVARLESDLERRSERILDDIMARGDDVIDFVFGIAHELPMHVIADIVGIPESDRPWVFEQTDVMLRSFDPESGTAGEIALAAQLGLYEYAQKLTEEKRARPTDDIWTMLTTAEVVDDDGNASGLGHQLDAFFMILSVAGSETTRNALSQGILAFAEEPEQFAALRRDPELLVPAADEVLRWSTPVLMFARTATRTVELGGETIEKGDRIVIWYPSANRDDRVFADPFRFDVTRTPNPHVSFGGGGPHYCLGANLAKKEIQVMLGALSRRFDRVEIAGAPEWSGVGPIHNVGVSLRRLPVRLSPS